jgi:hypothetical protein
MAEKWTVAGIEFLRTEARSGAPILVDQSGTEVEVEHGDEIVKGDTTEETIGSLTLKWTFVTAGEHEGFINADRIVPLAGGTPPPTDFVVFDEAVDYPTFAETCIRNALRWRTNGPFLFMLAHAESSEHWTDDKVSGPVDAESGATGAYQYLPEKWAALIEAHGADRGLTVEDIKFPEAQCTFAAIEAQRGAELLQGLLGRPVSALDLYLAHLFEPEGAHVILEAEQKNKNQKVESVLKTVYENDQSKIDAVSARKAKLLTADGPVTVKIFIERCVALLDEALTEVKAIAVDLAPEAPTDAGSDLTGVGSASPQAARIVAVAKKYVGRPYKNIRVDYTDPNWGGAFDCAEYATYCSYRVFSRLYGTTNNNDIAKADAYTGHWQGDSKPENLGHRIPVEDALKIPGAFVLRFPPSSGAMGHIGICVGDGQNIYEARGKNFGVGLFSAVGRKWNTGIKLPFAAHGAEAATSASNFEYFLKSPPMGQDNNIRNIEQALSGAGFLAASMIDGFFDEATSKAVELYQKANDLVVDGIVGPITGKLLLGLELWETIQSEVDEFQIPSTGEHDLLTLARTIYGEARNQTKKGKEAVAHVILNRLSDGRFPLNPGIPETIAGICLDPWQFSCWNKNDPNRSKIANLPLNSQDPDFKKCLKAAKDVLAAKIPDPTGVATHYFAKTIATPNWVHNSPKAVLAATIGLHIFYRGIK